MPEALIDVKKGKKGSLKDFVLDRFQHGREQNAEVHRSWMLNLAWTRGFQDVDYDIKTKQYQRANRRQPWKVRLISNLMLPIARRNVAQLVHTNPVWDVIPATSEEEDIQISRMSTKLLTYYWQFLDMTKVLIRLASWQAICSNGYLKVGWDKDAGEDLAYPTESIEEELAKAVLAEQGIMEFPDTVSVPRGELYIDPVPPFNMTVPDGIDVFEDADWCIESRLYTKDKAVELYGNKAKDIQETSEAVQFLRPHINCNVKQQKGILIHEFYGKKTKKDKDGLFGVFGHEGTELITPRRNPYDHKRLPYVHTTEIYDPGSYHGTCAVEQMRPQQARYNRINSAIMEQINQMANIQWLNPRQSGINTFTNKPGQVYTYNAPFKPEQTSLKPIPSYMDAFLNRTRLDIQDTASNHDVSEAKAEPGVRSGRAVLALQDADDSIKGPALLLFDQAVASAGRLALETIAQFVEEDRTVEIIGEFNELETITFNRQVLQGNSGKDYFKVRVKTYGRQALTRSARENLARTLIETQLLNPITHREEILQILGAADTVSIYDKSASDRAKQWKEIQDIIQAVQQGQEPQVKVYFGQNHSAHKLAVQKYMSGSEWEKLEPQVKEYIALHLRQHIEQEVLEAMYPQIFLSQFGGQNGGGTGTGGGTGGSANG